MPTVNCIQAFPASNCQQQVTDMGSRRCKSHALAAARHEQQQIDGYFGYPTAILSGSLVSNVCFFHSVPFSPSSILPSSLIPLLPIHSVHSLLHRQIFSLLFFFFPFPFFPFSSSPLHPSWCARKPDSTVELQPSIGRRCGGSLRRERFSVLQSIAADRFDAGPCSVIWAGSSRRPYVGA